MNTKRTFGAFLILNSIVGFAYTGIGILYHSVSTINVVVAGIISLLICFSGVSLMRTVKSEDR